MLLCKKFSNIFFSVSTLIDRTQTEQFLFCFCYVIFFLYILIAYFIQQATREAVLNRTEEHHDARMHSLQNATAVYDLLAIALVKRAQFNKLSDVSISWSNISQIISKLPWNQKHMLFYWHYLLYHGQCMMKTFSLIFYRFLENLKDY